MKYQAPLSMILRRYPLFSVGIVLLNFTALGQKITSVKVAQDSSKIEVTYDLFGKGDKYDVDLLYSTRKSLFWHGPLKKVSGDIKNQEPGVEKKMVFNLNDLLEFKLKAKSSPITKFSFDESKFPPDYFKYNRAKKIWLYSGIGAGTVCLATVVVGQLKYHDYQTATTKAMELHQEVRNYDRISVISLGIAGICALEYIHLDRKLRKIKRNTLNFSALPYCRGGMGIELAYSF